MEIEVGMEVRMGFKGRIFGFWWFFKGGRSAARLCFAASFCRAAARTVRTLGFRAQCLEWFSVCLNSFVLVWLKFGINLTSFLGTLVEDVQTSGAIKYTGFEPGTYGILNTFPRKGRQNVKRN